MNLPADPMSCEDRQHLLRQGFSEALIEELDRRGFKPCQPPKDSLPPGKVPRFGFLKQTSLPHLHIALTRYNTPDDLDHAIHDAGRRDGHDLLGMLFMRFFEAVKHRPTAAIPDLSTIEPRLAALEARLPTENSEQRTENPPA